MGFKRAVFINTALLVWSIHETKTSDCFLYLLMQIPNPKTFIGSGKMAEVENYVSENEVTTVVFDDELTPAQQGNIEKTFPYFQINEKLGVSLIDNPDQTY